MKYGYLSWRKPLLEKRKERRVNIGDVFQSIATIHILKSLGIADEDIIPLDRFDLPDYTGEKVVLLISGAEIDSDAYAYHTKYYPLPDNIIPVFVGWLPYRTISEEELAYLKQHQPIGCRSDYMVDFLREMGLDAFLTGCTTLTLPKREQTDRQKKVFLVDAPDSLLPYIPEQLLTDAVSLTQLSRINSVSTDLRITEEETAAYHRMAEDRLKMFRDEAALVITSRLHVASPCAAMGIPVVLARNSYDMRFQFIDRFLPLYTPETFSKIDWNPKTEIPENVKQEIIMNCKALIDLAISRENLKKIYSPVHHDFQFQNNPEVVVSNLPIDPKAEFSYAIMGVALESSYWLHYAMQDRFENARMVCAVDTFATGMFRDDIPIITPDEVEEKISTDTLLLVNVARDATKERFGGKYDMALINGSSMRFYPKEG
ncbi:MAG: polysaccharide pyruvyl transferase family protein [Lachnospiraceae bacterium]|nr:polysaccharide pyruvyl transferase family protein [Lachnospiraceae bacterium]